MYCMKCGKEIPDESAFCTFCGTDLNMKAPELEEVLKNGLCNRVVNSFYVQNGQAALTNKRFVYFKERIGEAALSAALNVALDATLNIDGAVPVDNSCKFELEIPIKKIASIEDGRQGISKTIIINTKDGERYNFYFTKREEWKRLFLNLCEREEQNQANKQ